jgi:hypothetical protein
MAIGRATSRVPVVMAALAALLLAGCGLLSSAVGAHPACVGQPDPTDCSAAVTVALDQFPGARFETVTITPIRCEAGECRTSVTMSPPGGRGAIQTVEMVRSAGGPWRAESFSHGDPPCAFDPNGCLPPETSAP